MKFEKFPSYDEALEASAEDGIVYASFPTDTVDGKFDLLSALNCDGVKLNDYKEIPFDIEKVAVSSRNSVDTETGDVKAVATLFIYPKSGDIIRTSAAAAYHSFERIISVFGEPSDWSGIKVTCAGYAIETKKKQRKTVGLKFIR